MNPIDHQMIMHSEPRSEAARFMRRLYRQGLTTTSGGNLSLRVSTAEIVLTGSRSDKGRLTARQVGVLTLQGENRTPEVVPSIEAAMHLELYRRYPEIGAVVHAHPPLRQRLLRQPGPDQLQTPGGIIRHHRRTGGGRLCPDGHS